MAAVIVLAEAVRSSFTNTFHINAGTPRTFIARLVSTSDWDTPGWTWTCLQEWSTDGGATWINKSPDTWQSAQVAGKDGSNRPAVGLSWDGSAMDVRVTLSSSVAKSWGLSLQSS